jgi:hypothetical protein
MTSTYGRSSPEASRPAENVQKLLTAGRVRPTDGAMADTMTMKGPAVNWKRSLIVERVRAQRGLAVSILFTEGNERDAEVVLPGEDLEESASHCKSGRSATLNRNSRENSRDPSQKTSEIGKRP